MVIRTIRNLEELETVRACWENWQDYPISDFCHFQLICRLRPEVICPHVTVVERNGEPCALLVARLEHSHFTPSIGYLKLARIPSKIITVLHRGLIGEVANETALALVQHLLVLLSSGEADAVAFHKVPEHSPLHRALVVLGSRWLCEKKPTWSTHWSMDLQYETGFLLKKLKSKHRSWLRRKQRELEFNFPGKVNWHWLREIDDVPGLCSLIEPVAARSYQRGLGAGFVEDEEHRQRFTLFASRGQLRVQLLEIDGQVRAYWIGAVYQGVFHSWETGYDPELHVFEPGTLIFLRMVDQLVLEGVRKLDFGLGDGAYKRRFGDHSLREGTIRFFVPSAKGVAIRSVLGMTGMLDGVARRFLEKAGLLNRLKTGWRRRLAAADLEFDTNYTQRLK